jgi:hypothetical protein
MVPLRQRVSKTADGSRSGHLLVTLTPEMPLMLDLGVSGVPTQPLRIPRKEVIQPHLPVRLPCYDFTPVT